MNGAIRIDKTSGVLAEHNKLFALDPEQIKFVNDFMGMIDADDKAFRRYWRREYFKLFRNSNVWTQDRSWRREDEIAEVQGRWDARRDRMRMERNTGPAMGATRRQGRL